MDINKLWREYNRLKFNLGGGRKSLLDNYYKGFERIRLSKEQQRQIQDYWIPICGKTVKTEWHQLLYSLCGHFTPAYMPLDVYNDLIAHWAPSFKVMAFFDDKNLYRYLFNGFKMPKRIVEHCNGVYYLPEESDSEVTGQRVIERCFNIENCIIKPSKNSSAGIGVKPFIVKEGRMLDGSNVRDFLKSYRNDYVIEEMIQESENLSRLNPSSCNSLRIHTWRNAKDERVEFVSAYVRIGREGNIIDNASSGGITCQVKLNGRLSDNACTVKHYSPIVTTDSGVRLAGYLIEGFEEMKKTAILAHSRVPYFGIIGWDICIDANNEPVIIEYNPNPDLRIEQLIFKDSCLLDKQKSILKQVYCK